ncbi:A disintegrin and metalloproteinase with thrombospondin motifs like [Diachasmimorpha longicaudata]|uniref:A disintegrin and metalloproteinase with thrombospondin motifs like n=1 Tax=Diachasmimorpha longicaudata TaxID=58733 RepID=UPI0030B8F9F6
MKIVISFLIFFFPVFSYCTNEFGEPWLVQVKLKNKKTMSLNLTLTDGILIDSETPVFRAKRKNSNRKIEYTPSHEVMRRIGNFDLYQDYANKAAVVVFHKGNITMGWVQQQRLEELTYTQTNPDVVIHNRNKSFPFRTKQSSSRYPSTVWSIGLRPPQTGRSQSPYVRTIPDVVYPEILIQIDVDDARKDEDTAVRQMIAYWNGVDMLFSKLENPRIKMNIAGLIIPMDNYTTPWFSDNEHRNENNMTYIQSGDALESLGIHFSTLRQQFPDYKYDLMFSFVSSRFDSQRSRLGISFVNVSCAYRERRIALISTLHSYTIAAHELGHAFSCAHDNRNSGSGIMKGLYNNWNQQEWSNFSQSQMKDYFSTARSECFDNCPSTMKNCLPPLSLHCVVSARFICHMAGYNYKRQSVDCASGLLCHDRDEDRPNRTILLPIPNGMVSSRWSRSKTPATICHEGERIDYDEKIPQCETKY